MKRRQKRRIYSGALAALLIFDALSAPMNLLADESQKIHQVNTVGKYLDYEQKIELNQELQLDSTVGVITKNAISFQQDLSDDSNNEIEELRTENTKTFQQNDGTYITEIFFEPIHVLENETFVEVDNTLLEVEPMSLLSNEGTPVSASYMNTKGHYQFMLQDNHIAMFDEEGSIVIQQHGNTDNIDVQGNVILYSEIHENIDMEVIVGYSSIDTMFYINGPISQNQISYQINAMGLNVVEDEDVLLFKNGDQLVYAYVLPTSRTNSKISETSYEIIDGKVHVNITLLSESVNSIEQVYPIQMSSRMSNQTAQISVTTGYSRQLQPNRVSQYEDLFVGNANFWVVDDFGVARTYIKVNELNLGPDKLIESAHLSLYKKQPEPSSGNGVYIGMSTIDTHPSLCTWNGRPSINNIGYTYVDAGTGYRNFDVTSYIQAVYNGSGAVIELSAENESIIGVALASEHNPNFLPSLTVVYRDAYDVDPNLDINTFDTEMRVYSTGLNQVSQFSFDGIAKPSSRVIFDLVEKGETSILKTNYSNESDKMFVNPIFITNPQAGVQTHIKSDVNYTTPYINDYLSLEKDVPYEYDVRVQHTSGESTVNYKTDGFIRYEVKLGDNLKSIAGYYGVSIDTIKFDNNLTSDKVVEGDELFIRLAANNPKVSKDVYTPPLRTVIYQAEYVNLGPYCSYGSCSILDPINSTTGNYYYEDIDFSLQDAAQIDFVRYYNSMSPRISNMFGNGFTTLLESYISYDKNDNILMFLGDGKIFEFEKSGEDYLANVSDNMKVTLNGDQVTVVDLETKDTYIYDSYGYLSQLVREDGYTTTIQYNEYGQIISAQIGYQTIQFEYNEQNLVGKVILPSGNFTRYEYDGNHNLIKYIDTRNEVTTYHYDANNYLLSITDKNGQTMMANTYDADGRVLTQVDGNGNSSSIAYLSGHTIVTNADGSEDSYYFNDLYDITSIHKNGELQDSYTYNDNRLITSHTDIEGKVTKYTYEGLNLTQIEHPDGLFESYEYNSNDQVTAYTDQVGNTVEYTYLNGNVTNVSSDDKNTTYVYDNQNRVIQETDVYGASKTYTYSGNLISSITYDNGLVESFMHDANGNVIKEADNQGKNITYIYDPLNQMIQKNYTDGTNEKWNYDANGNVVTYQDRLGGISTNTYDKNNNLLSTSKGKLVQSYTYDAMNRMISETDVVGNTTQYKYDEFGNRVEIINPYGKSMFFEYDDKHQLVKTINEFGKEEISVYENDLLVSKTDVSGLETKYEYNDLNQLIKQTNPNGTVETKEYLDNLIIREVDQFGFVMEYEYDDTQRLIQIKTTYPDGGTSIVTNTYDKYSNVISTSNNGAITSYEYDVYQREVRVTNPLNQTTEKVYDVEGRVIEKIDPLGNREVFKLDGESNVVEKKDLNGNVTKYHYDANGILVSEEDALGFVKTYTYNERGLLINVIDPYSVIFTYSYDNFGNQIETGINGKVVEVKGYDEYGREVHTITNEENTELVYDEYSRIIEIRNIYTGLVEFSEYDAYGNVVKKWDNQGKTEEFEYDELQRLIKTVDSIEREELNVYNERNQLSSTTDYQGLTTTYEYDVFGNQIRVVDYLGNETIKEYDLNQQLIQTMTSTQIIQYHYDDNGRQVEINNQTTGAVSRSIFDNNGNEIQSIDALGNSVYHEYNALNQKIKTIDANGNETNFEFDVYGNIIKVMDSLGNSTQTIYNEFGLVEKEIDERGFAVIYEYNDDLLVSKIIDGNSNVISFEYDDNMQKVKEMNPLGGEILYKYDAYGRIIETTYPNGRIEKKEYDVLGNIIKIIDGDRVTENTYNNGLLVSTKVNGVVQVKNTYNGYGQIIQKENALGQKVMTEYNQFGQVEREESASLVIEYDYDSSGNVIKEVLQNTFITTSEYDLLGRLTIQKENAIITANNKYDGNGNLISELANGVLIEYTYNENNKISSTSIASEVIQTIEYDASGNPIKISDAQGALIQKKYDANNNVVEEINALNEVTRYEYNALNQPTKVQNAQEQIITYGYDESGNLIRKYINNRAAEYEYDIYQQLISENDEYGYSHRYVYDLNGNQIEHHKPDGTMIASEYNSLNQLIKKNNQTYTYDENGNEITATNQYGTVETTYDDFGNIKSVLDTNGNLVEYTYDANQRKVKQVSLGSVIEYVYDDYRLLEVVENGVVVAQYKYNERGEEVQLIQGDLITSKSYDGMGRLVAQVTKENNVVISSLKYVYDLNGNVIEEVIDGKANTYKYNELDELIESEKTIDGEVIKTVYTYDLYGNQTTNSSSSGKQTYTYNEQQQVESIQTNDGIIRFTYDDNGNLLQKLNENGRVDRYEYDELGQLSALTQGDYRYEYEYDAQGERTVQSKADQRTYSYDIWWDDYHRLDTVRDKEVEDVFEHLRSQEEILSSNNNSCIVVVEEQETINYKLAPEVIEYTLDRTQENTTVIGLNQEVHIYGNELIKEGQENLITGLNESIVAKVDDVVDKIEYLDYGYSSDVTYGLGYNSQMQDTTGLIYLRARYYDPTVSRFISIDNNYKGETQDILSHNRYAYTLNNPYKYVDIDGNIAVYDNGYGNISYNNDSLRGNSNNVSSEVVTKGVSVKLDSSKSLFSIAKSSVDKSNKLSAIGTLETTKFSYADKVKPVINIDVKANCLSAMQETIRGSVHFALDVIGILPFAGEGADLLNAVLYFSEGDQFNGFISIACAVFSFYADIILKPLKSVVSSIGDLIKHAVDAIPNLLQGIVGALNALADHVIRFLPISNADKLALEGMVKDTRDDIVQLFVEHSGIESLEKLAGIAENVIKEITESALERTLKNKLGALYELFIKEGLTSLDDLVTKSKLWDGIKNYISRKSASYDTVLLISDFLRKNYPDFYMYVVRNVNYGNYAKNVLGLESFYEEVIKAHAHHIVFKIGLGSAQKELVQEGQEILLKYGIDPVFGKEVIAVVTNKAGTHTLETMENVVDLLRKADSSEGTKEAIIAALTDSLNALPK